MVMASLCIAVFVDGRVVLCLHRGRCVARSSHGSVQCCIQALLPTLLLQYDTDTELYQT